MFVAMPREFKPEKLNRKFSSLTRSKESIQSLSSWIISHKNFRDEIAEQWLNAVEKADISHRLTLFYVANDVLQNCKRKGAVEFRNSFAEVLEDALAFAKDANIKDEILRMITIWGERNVLSPSILKLLSDQVNKIYESPINKAEPDSPPLTEAEVIETFDLHKLLKSIKSLKEPRVDVSDRFDKKSGLSRLELSQLNVLDIRINSDMPKMYTKLEQTSKALEECIQDLEQDVLQEKSVLKMLEISKIFYIKQNEDVRKVAHAYKLFGKKLKIVKDALNLKMKSFESPIDISNSPMMDIIPDSTDDTVSSSTTDKTETTPIQQTKNSEMLLTFLNQTAPSYTDITIEKNNESKDLEIITVKEGKKSTRSSPKPSNKKLKSTSPIVIDLEKESTIDSTVQANTSDIEEANEVLIEMINETAQDNATIQPDIIENATSEQSVEDKIEKSDPEIKVIDSNICIDISETSGKNESETDHVIPATKVEMIKEEPEKICINENKTPKDLEFKKPMDCDKKSFNTEKCLFKSVKLMTHLLSKKGPKKDCLKKQTIFPLKGIIKLLNQELKVTKHSLPSNSEENLSKKSKSSDVTSQSLEKTDISCLSKHTKTDINFEPMDMELDSENDD